MFRVSATLRLAIGLAFLGISVYLASCTVGLGRNEWATESRNRAALSESIALHASHLLARGDTAYLDDTLKILVQRNHDLMSIGLRNANKKLVAQAGNHEAYWRDDVETTDGQLYVPIDLRRQRWGQLELRFTPRRIDGLIGFLKSRSFLQLAFVLSAGTLLYSFYLRKMLSHLDPSKVIPDRVRAALDTFAEGLLVIDKGARIVLANKAIKETLGESASDLQGRRVRDLPWKTTEPTMPWDATLSDGKARTGQMVDLQLTKHHKITYMINASPILSEKGELQGVLASFDDVTLHEQRKQELERTLRVLGESREQIRKQNDELRILATRDPLTGCMNRRSFFEQVAKVWDDYAMSGEPIACIMVDVDHFKAVNDNHGHAAGDEVLRCVGKTLVDLEGSGALPCRYGGEEFCVTLVGYDLEMAREYAEEIRTVLEAQRPAGIAITASLGVSMVTDISESIEDVLEQADQCLYVAKRQGRNQVICWGDFGDDELQQTEKDTRTKPAEPIERSGIPFHAVSALLSALSYRDASTAEHSRRVADLCVRVANEMVSVRDQYIIETAALLHDIGKIGTPDAVLLKPGPLNEEERDVMSHHDMIGLEIVRSTFDDEDLASVIENHYAWYGGHPLLPNMPTHEDIPLGARILAIADSYDAMVNDRVYRKACSQQEAFDELRRCAGSQFDPKLVEVFIETISAATDTSASDEVSVPKRAALRIGLIMDALTMALEHRDEVEIRAQAQALSIVATETKLHQLAKIAAEISDADAADVETDQLINIASTLLDLCRTTQRAYLGVGAESRRRREELAVRQFRDVEDPTN